MREVGGEQIRWCDRSGAYRWANSGAAFWAATKNWARGGLAAIAEAKTRIENPMNSRTTS